MEYLTSRILTFVGMTLLSLVILVSIAFYIARTLTTRKDGDIAPAESAADEAIARAIQAGGAAPASQRPASSPAWQQPAGSLRAAQPAARSRFGQRAPAR